MKARLKFRKFATPRNFNTFKNFFSPRLIRMKPGPVLKLIRLVTLETGNKKI